MSEDISILARQNMTSIYQENRRHPKLGHTRIHVFHYVGEYEYTSTFKFDIALNHMQFIR
jgi:hypothetical protein